MKIYPLSKKIQVFGDNLEVLFDMKSKSLVKKEISSKIILALSPTEKMFYQKIFFKYLFETKSWQPRSFENALERYNLPRYKAINR
ncbi:MAG: hypothetical protein HRT47_07005 [Candidatus Caenarcaniphilales bacterium]|nr:hypothetical protein [Candidatus Caenarcaniphilales bacterium]